MHLPEPTTNVITLHVRTRCRQMGKHVLLDAIQSAFGTATPAYSSAPNTLATYVHRVRESDMLQATAYQHRALSAHSPFT